MTPKNSYECEQENLALAKSVAAANRGWMSVKFFPPAGQEKCFYLTSPFIEPAKVPKSEVRAMLKMLLHAKKWVLIAEVCISACAISGCLESSFNLANESRLPRGLAIPPGLTRADVSVTSDFIGISRATFTLRDKTGKKLTTVTGKTKGDPKYLSTTPQAPVPRYPSYQLVVINGVTEIMEQRRPEDIIYVTDDPAVWKELLAGGSGLTNPK